MMKIDLHIHTINSGHAYGTFYDVVNEAQDKNMNLIAITDHGPSMNGTSGWIHFLMGERAPKLYGNLRVLWGCEANVINGNGDLDISEKIQNSLELISVGLHGSCAYTDLGFEKNTEAVKKALSNPKVKIFTHPTHVQYKCDWEALVYHAIENDVLPELNLSYLERKGKKDFDKFKRLVDIVKEKKGKLIINSDAHFVHEIGDDSILEEYWDKLGLSNELIINNYPDELNKFLEID